MKALYSNQGDTFQGFWPQSRTLRELDGLSRKSWLHRYKETILDVRNGWKNCRGQSAEALTTRSTSFFKNLACNPERLYEIVRMRRRDIPHLQVQRSTRGPKNAPINAIPRIAKVYENATSATASSWQCST